MTKQELHDQLAKIELKLLENLANGGAWDYQEEQALTKVIMNLTDKLED